MRSELFWIEGPWPGRLAISARPRGGDWLNEEIRAWSAAGITTVVSLLEAQEAAHFELEQESEVCAAHKLAYASLPIADRGVPETDDATRKLIDFLHSELRRGRQVNVHCRQGIGRSGLIAASLLIESGVQPEEAVRRVTAARGVTIPETAGQREWIDHFAAAVGRRR